MVKSKPKSKRRTSNPPSQREIGRGEPSNHPSQRDIGGGETCNPPPPPPQEEIGGGKEIVMIDTDLLDCSICTYPLCPPIHQCTNGHVACHTCWSKLKDKCHICSLPVLSRNIALEKVLESVHLPCTYANLGCPKSVSYSQRQVHTDTCDFGPSSCPIPGCGHKAFSGKWRGHFMKDHWETCHDYSYGQSIDILFDAVMLLVNIWTMGQDETTWRDPYKFLPDRFSEKEIDFKGCDFELIPFGAGQRICPGLPLAHRMVHLMLGSLLHWFEWKLPEEAVNCGVNMSEKFGVTLAIAPH